MEDRGDKGNQTVHFVENEFSWIKKMCGYFDLVIYCSESGDCGFHSLIRLVSASCVTGLMLGVENPAVHDL